MIALSRVDTLKPIVLDLASEEGGYPKDVFTAADLPGGRGARLSLEWMPGICVVARRCEADFVKSITGGPLEGRIVGVIPESAVISMRVVDPKALQSHLDSL